MNGLLGHLLDTEPAGWQIAAMVCLLVSAAVPLYTYFGYPLLLILVRPLRRHSPVRDMDEGELPSVTMVAAAHNESAIIAEKVRNFLSIDYPEDRLGLLIGSDASDDDTVYRAGEAAGNCGRVEVRDFAQRRGKAGVLNEIVPTCETPIVLFSDANTMYEPDAVRKLVRHFTRPRTGGVCGRFILERAGEDASLGEGLYWAYESRIKLLEGETGGLSSITGPIFAIRRELYEPAPADSMTEDQYLGLRILARGYKIYYEPEAAARETIGSFEEEKRRRLRISTGNFQTLFRAGLAMLNPLKGFHAFAYISHKVLRWMVPLAMLLAFVSNAILAGIPAARWLLAGQCVFYGLAMLPSVLPFSGRLSFIRVVRYFVVMNLTVAGGFLRYIFVRQEAAWERSSRE